MQLRHQSASGRLDESWSFDPKTRFVCMTGRMGNAAFAVHVEVCSAAYPREGAYPIVRVNGESWRILPSRYTRISPFTGVAVVAVGCAVIAVLGPGKSVLLTNTPDDVDALLERLSER